MTNNDTGKPVPGPVETPTISDAHLAAHGMPPQVAARGAADDGIATPPLDEEAAAAAEKQRPWGPNSFFRSGIVVMAILIAGLLFIQLFSGGPAPN